MHEPNKDWHPCDNFFNRHVGNYDTRYNNANYLVTPRIDNNFCRQSVLYNDYMGPKFFNDIPQDIRVNSPTLNSIKQRLKTFIS